MLLSLSSAATGMDAQQLNLNNISNNLANVNTTGYKRSKIEFQDLLYQQQRAAGSDVSDSNVLPAGVELGNGSRVVSTAKVLHPGPAQADRRQIRHRAAGRRIPGGPDARRYQIIHSRRWR